MMLNKTINNKNKLLWYSFFLAFWHHLNRVNDNLNSRSLIRTLKWRHQPSTFPLTTNNKYLHDGCRFLRCVFCDYAQLHKTAAKFSIKTFEKFLKIPSKKTSAGVFFLNKVSGCWPAFIYQKRFQHGCFYVNFA